MTGGVMVAENLDAHKREIGSLRRSVAELTILNDLARSIGASHDFNEIMNTVIRRSCRAVNATQATITMIDPDEAVSAGTIVRDRRRDSPDFHLTQGLIGLMAALKQPLLINEPHLDDKLNGIPLQDEVRNMACAPLLVGNRLVGILAAFNKRDGSDFDNDDKRVLAIIGAQSAQILERARLFELEQASLAMREELRMATAIQSGLLPDAAPDLAGYDIHGLTFPALQVGGDYFDFIEAQSGRHAVAIGDISGKGVPAALLMANLQATLRSLALQETDCCATVRKCSTLLFRSTPNTRFATLFYCIIDPVSHNIEYCNAGHERPIIFATDGSTRELSTGGVPAGVLSDFDYCGDRTGLAPGEVLVMYSDGVPDMLNAREESFGLQRMIDCVQQVRSKSAETIASAVAQAVRDFAGPVPAMDDVTVVVVKRLAV